MELIEMILILWLIWNVITFALMGIDKWKARRDGWRISEATLLGTSFFMGAVGSLLGSYIFHHKTQKKKFRIGLPLALLVNIAVFIAVWFLLFS